MNQSGLGVIRQIIDTWNKPQKQTINLQTKYIHYHKIINKCVVSYHIYMLVSWRHFEVLGILIQ